MTEKTVIAGSRSITDEDFVKVVIDHAHKHADEIETDVVISGGADGVDSIAEAWAEENDKDVEVYEPEYEKFEGNPKVAPIVRNARMAKHDDNLIAIWDGESAGTESMINKAKKRDLDIFVMKVDKDD